VTLTEPNDFRPDEIVKEHSRDIGELRTKIEKLVERFGDDDCFVRTLEEIAKKDKRVDELVKHSLSTLIATDPDIKNEMTKHLKGLDRDWWRIAGRRLGYATFTVIVAVLSGIAGHFIP